jgi:polysaccharide biosynthesis/export protein
MVFRVVIAFLAAIVAASTRSRRRSSGSVRATRIRIEVLEDPSLNRDVLVLPDGSVSFPLAGAVRAGGQTTTKLESALASALAPNFATSPTVSVSVAGSRQRGGTGAPRRSTSTSWARSRTAGACLQVERGTTVLQALRHVGRLFASRRQSASNFAEPIRRSGQQSRLCNINYKDIERGASERR